MAGANYMGGKRNAAKSRAKDKINRAQKRFFGQQRLNLASKNLTEEKYVSLPPRMRPISDITFAHAQGRIQGTTDNTGFLSEPIHVAPCTPTCRIRLKKINEQNAEPESSSKASKVLEAIDTTEPVSLRAAMDRILALPDLAGLSRPKRRRSPSESLPVLKKNVTRGRFSFSGNVFDYEDPWKVVGLVLGVEKSLHSPPKTRNFSAMLAHTPSPSSFGSEFRSVDSPQQYGRDSLFSGCSTQDEPVIWDDEQSNQLYGSPGDVMDETQSSQLNSLFSCYSVVDDAQTYMDAI